MENQVFDQRLEQAMSQNQRWIMDGNYSRTLDRRLARCHRVFFLDYPVEVCLEGVRARRGTVRPDIPGWRRRRTRSSWTISGLSPAAAAEDLGLSEGSPGKEMGGVSLPGAGGRLPAGAARGNDRKSVKRPAGVYGGSLSVLAGRYSISQQSSQTPS